MELNFFSNLSLTEFARLSARSLSAFKKEFTRIYNTTPGKWLMEKRLEYSYYLLETTVKVWMIFAWRVALKTKHILAVCLKINMVSLQAK